METNKESLDTKVSRTDEIVYYSLDNFAEFLADDFLTFPRQPFAVNDAGGQQLALATRGGCLIITDGTITTHGTHAVEGETDTVIELTIGAVVSVLLWVSDVVCVGFENGVFAVFNIDGQMLFEKQYHEERITSLRMSGKIEKGHGYDGFLWVMFAKGLLVQLLTHELLVGHNDENHVKYKFVENTVVTDFVVLSTLYMPSIFGEYDESKESSEAAGTHSLLISGRSDAHDMGGGGALSMYTVGGKQYFQHLGKLGNFVKTQVISTISRAFQSFLPVSAHMPGRSNAAQASTTQAIASLVDFEDPKRHVLRLCQDPSGSLVAAGDSLGRVVLYDSSVGLNVVIRLWKGVRDAQLAWSSSSSASAASASLCLAIYAPQLGLVSFYAMKHGPCLRVVPVPVGSLCQLYTRLDNGADASCTSAHRR